MGYYTGRPKIERHASIPAVIELQQVHAATLGKQRHFGELTLTNPRFEAKTVPFKVERLKLDQREA